MTFNTDNKLQLTSEWLICISYIFLSYYNLSISHLIKIRLVDIKCHIEYKTLIKWINLVQGTENKDSDEPKREDDYGSINELNTGRQVSQLTPSQVQKN